MKPKNKSINVNPLVTSQATNKQINPEVFLTLGPFQVLSLELCGVCSRQKSQDSEAKVQWAAKKVI